MSVVDDGVNANDIPVAVVAGALVTAATDKIVRATPLGSASALIASAAGDLVVHVLEHGGLDAIRIQLGISPDHSSLPSSPDGDAMEKLHSSGSSIPGSALNPSVHDAARVPDHVNDGLGWKHRPEDIIAPGDHGTSLIEGRDFAG
jgi:hypothetical protein